MGTIKWEKPIPMGASLGASLRGLEEEWLNHAHLLDLFERPPPTIYEGSDILRALFVARKSRVARGSGLLCCG